MKQIYFVTSNSYKFSLAKNYFDTSGVFELIQEPMETPEIQSKSSEEIARYSAIWAANVLNKPVICTDAAFSIKSLNGFPGPFVKYINEWLSPNDIIRLMSGIGNRSAEFIDILALAYPDGSSGTFIRRTKGAVAERVYQSNSKWTIDSLFIPDGFNKPLSAMDNEEKNRVWDQTIWKDLAQHVKNNKPLKKSL